MLLAAPDLLDVRGTFVRTAYTSCTEIVAREHPTDAVLELRRTPCVLHVYSMHGCHEKPSFGV